MKEFKLDIINNERGKSIIIASFYIIKMTQPFESLLGAEGVTEWKKHSLCKPDDQNLGLQNVSLGRGGGLL